VIWLAPILEDVAPQGRYRFRVTVEGDRGAARVYYSMPFRVDLTPTHRRQNRIELDTSGTDETARC
jgi:hypothetical protein